MVKTLHGRKPGRKHAKIVKQLRHRRRMAASKAAVARPTVSTQLSSSALSSSTAYLNSTTVSSSTASWISGTTMSRWVSSPNLHVLKRELEMQHVSLQPPKRHLYFTLSETNCLLSFDENSDAVVVKVSDIPAVEEKDKQIVLYKISGGNRNRHVSEAAVVIENAAAKNVDRSTVSESDLHQTAIPMPAPPLLALEWIDILDFDFDDDDDDANTSTAHEGYFSDEEDNGSSDYASALSEDEEEEYHPVIAPPPPSHHDDDRMQHTDEVTDRYLSHLFTPSIANITTATDEYTQNDTHSIDSD